MHESNRSDSDQLPPIPSKRYFTIGEVSKLCNVKTHVLRYWEQEFPEELKPIKRRGNRRYYQRHDIMMVRQIRSLLYEQGFKIEGAKQQLAGESAKQDLNHSSQLIEIVCNELEAVLETLKGR
jgi:DNA-binding transcriptional MerR regulator